MILNIKSENSRCEILFCKDAFARLAKFSGGDGLVVTDRNVCRLYQEKFDKFCNLPIFVMEAGEAHKSEETLFALLRKISEEKLCKNSRLIAVGGGVVGDLAGLAAALYMRGIELILIPTTLLSQADSAVGGKTALDFAGVKNLIGTYKFPAKVFIDSGFLHTLSMRELRCGLGEIVKHGALCPPLFAELSGNAEKLFDLDFLAEIVPANVTFKASVVRRDPRETGLRKCLNLGHTTAHALELSHGSSLSHGECVAAGIIYESMIAQKYFDCDGEFLARLRALCLVVLGGLPSCAAEELCGALLDKKNTKRGSVVLTVPVAAGKYELLELPYEEYLKEFKAVYGRC